ncbi:hypothetical protein P4O66_022147 [Electrophorus voltai]|uniref:Alkylated DNA repair protein AlkB homologue 8 N-terminal domain-containing protein n=1 Tax=Electrophorus voltai TaxID=2609070 RepID=A0AAD8ZPH8_9TELE|nr:hypothetical protein P4O66_022147 [Electrophorus voltai]
MGLRSGEIWPWTKNVNVLFTEPLGYHHFALVTWRLADEMPKLQEYLEKEDIEKKLLRQTNEELILVGPVARLECLRREKEELENSLLEQLKELRLQKQKELQVLQQMLKHELQEETELLQKQQEEEEHNRSIKTVMILALADMKMAGEQEKKSWRKNLRSSDCHCSSVWSVIVKFADDTVVMGLISDNDERAYLPEIKHLEKWCQENNLLLNVSKTKELIVDCSKKQERHYQPVRISGTTVERVDSFRYLGVHILQDLSRSRHTNSLAKKARQRLYHLRRLRDFRLPSKVLRNFYTCTIESILTGNITVWFGNSTKQDRQTLQRVVRSAERITHTEPLALSRASSRGTSSRGIQPGLRMEGGAFSRAHHSYGTS